MKWRRCSSSLSSEQLTMVGWVAGWLAGWLTALLSQLSTSTSCYCLQLNSFTIAFLHVHARYCSRHQAKILSILDDIRGTPPKPTGVLPAFIKSMNESPDLFSAYRISYHIADHLQLASQLHTTIPVVHAITACTIAAAVYLLRCTVRNNAYMSENHERRSSG